MVRDGNLSLFIYLMALFAFLLVDHYLAEPIQLRVPASVFKFSKVN